MLVAITAATLLVTVTRNSVAEVTGSKPNLEQAKEVPTIDDSVKKVQEPPKLSAGSVTFTAHFFRLPIGLAMENSTTIPGISPAAPVKSGSVSSLSSSEPAGLQDDRATVSKLSRSEAEGFVKLTRASSNLKAISAPKMTTTSGRSARIEVGEVLAAQEPHSKDHDDSFSGVYSVNAKGYVTSKVAPHANGPTLIGQSLELLPELHDQGMLVAGKFRVDAPKENPVAGKYAGTFYVSLAGDECFAITQSNRDGNENLLLLIIPER